METKESWSAGLERRLVEMKPEDYIAPAPERPEGVESAGEFTDDMKRAFTLRVQIGQELAARRKEELGLYQELDRIFGAEKPLTALADWLGEDPAAKCRRLRWVEEQIDSREKMSEELARRLALDFEQCFVVDADRVTIYSDWSFSVDDEEPPNVEDLEKLEAFLERLFYPFGRFYEPRKRFSVLDLSHLQSPEQLFNGYFGGLCAELANEAIGKGSMK